MPRRSSVTATTALAVGAIACALPGALAGSNAPRGFPRDCIKEATLGKCVVGDKIFGDTPDPKVIDAMKDLLFHPLMSGPDDAATLSGFSKIAKKAKKKVAVAILPVKVDEKLKKAAEEAAEKAKKVADALKGDSDKKQKETDEVEKAVKTAEDAVEAAKKKLEDAMEKRDAKAIKKAKAALDGLKGKADIQKKKFKGIKEAAQKAAKAAQKAMEDAKKRFEDVKKSQDAALAEGEIPGDMNTAPDSEQVSILKSALQGCDVSTIAQCMMDSNVPEAQAKGKEIKNMISGSKWKSIDVACSYKSVNGKPSCEDLLKNKPKLAIPRRARLGAEQAQGQTGAAYVAVIASVAAFAGYTVYQRRQQDEPLPTYEGYGTM